MHRVLNRLGRVLCWRDIARIATREQTAYLDLTDLRLFTVFDELFASQPEHLVLAKLLEPGDTLIDVGANHGAFALCGSRIVGEAGLVIAIEPNPRLAPLVQNSLEANSFSRWVVHNMACGEKNGEVDLFIPTQESSGTASLHESFNWSPTKAVRVSVNALDELLAQQELPGKLTIKLDIEGAEMSFLRGAQETIKRHRPPILFELNPIAASASGHTVEELFAQLAHLGYRWFSEINDYPARVSRNELDLTRHRNLVAIPS